MVRQHVTKAYRQHGTTVTSVPLAVRVALDLKQGDYLMWQVDTASSFVQVCKVVPGGVENGGNSGNPDRKDKGR